MLFNNIYIHATGGIYNTVNEAGELVALKSLVAEVCKQRYRRIDRFIQMALIGSGRCLQNSKKNAIELSVQTALYLASGQGPTSNNIDVQESIFKYGEEAKPLKFINTLSNSAGFYVMKEAQLTGQNIFVTREIIPLECALQTAVADLNAGWCDSALVGLVDEITLPMSDQCLRMKLAKDTAIGEGSYWFLLLQNKNNAQAKIEGLFIDCTVNKAINSALKQTENRNNKPLYVFIGRHISESFAEQVSDYLSAELWQKYSVVQAVWDGINSAAVYNFINQPDVGAATLWVVSEDREGRISILVVSRFA